MTEPSKPRTFVYHPKSECEDGSFDCWPLVEGEVPSSHLVQLVEKSHADALEQRVKELEESNKVQHQFGVTISEQCFKRDMTIKMYKGYSLTEKELSHIHPDDIHDYQEAQRINKEASQGIFLALTQRCDELKAEQSANAELSRKLAIAVRQRNALRNAISKHHGLNQADTMYAIERLDAELNGDK